MFFLKSDKHSHRNSVMAFGTFDLLHAGHEHYLQQAKQLGDHLIVVVSRDQTVRSVKGENPTNSEKARVENLKKTGWADKVILGNLHDKHAVILKYKPKILALGHDQFVFTQKLGKTLIDSGLDTEIIRLMPYHPQVYKSSILRQKSSETESSLLIPEKPAIQLN
ncbi:MAG: adenylyltransferase/cytidyltransferase family protein [Candidatus Altimarinota bacterium]